jgi:ATP-dependent DNA helicase RecQ
VAPEEVAADVKLSARKLTSALQRLEDAGAAEMLPDGRVRSVPDADPETAAEAAAEAHEVLRQARRERLDTMRQYAETKNCRRELLLRYLGDAFTGPCGSCDNCEIGAGKPVETNAGTRREVT